MAKCNTITPITTAGSSPSKHFLPAPPQFFADFRGTLMMIVEIRAKQLLRQNQPKCVFHARRFLFL